MSYPESGLRSDIVTVGRAAGYESHPPLYRSDGQIPLADYTLVTCRGNEKSR